MHTEMIGMIAKSNFPLGRKSVKSGDKFSIKEEEARLLYNLNLASYQQPAVDEGSSDSKQQLTTRNMSAQQQPAPRKTSNSSRQSAPRKSTPAKRQYRRRDLTAED